MNTQELAHNSRASRDPSPPPLHLDIRTAGDHTFPHLIGHYPCNAGRASKALPASLCPARAGCGYPAASPHALQPQWNAPSLARFSSQRGWQYGSTAQPWGPTGFHAFHCFSSPQSPSQRQEDESLRRRGDGSGGRRQQPGLHTSARPHTQLRIVDVRSLLRRPGFKSGLRECNMKMELKFLRWILWWCRLCTLLLV